MRAAQPVPCPLSRAGGWTAWCCGWTATRRERTSALRSAAGHLSSQYSLQRVVHLTTLHDTPSGGYARTSLLPSLCPSIILSLTSLPPSLPPSLPQVMDEVQPVMRPPKHSAMQVWGVWGVVVVMVWGGGSGDGVGSVGGSSGDCVGWW